MTEVCGGLGGCFLGALWTQLGALSSVQKKLSIGEIFYHVVKLD